MTAFFVLTDGAIEGPFTGVELREAALAGILRHDGIVGGDPKGPWFKASDVGLFSDKKAPLPHPPDTRVPQYQVRGMPGAFQGPFKLRELIGFAARGMLPPGALLQSDDSQEWIAAERFRVLAACLNGNLVLIDESGKVVVRNASAAEAFSEAVAVEGGRAPIELAKSADMQQATSLASEVSAEDANFQPELWPTQRPVTLDAEATERPPSKLSQLWVRFRSRLPEIRLSIPPRLAIQLVCILLVFVGVASAFSYWKQIGLRRDQVIGDWVALNDGDESQRRGFGISLQQDGHCVIFNTHGDSWTGGFEWDEWNEDQNGFEPIAPFSTFFDEVDPAHQAGVVKPTDGYVRLQGFVKRPPMIDGHPVRDLFLRRVGKQLHIGYLASVHWSEEAKTMEAGWMIASRSQAVRPDIPADLRAVEIQVPVPMEDYGGGTPLPISEAIDVVQKGVLQKEGEEETLVHGSMAYSAKVNATYLIEEYGLPDESRRIYPFEVPRVRNGPSFDRAQLVRYGELQFILSDQGQLRYLSLVTQTNF